MFYGFIVTFCLFGGAFAQLFLQSACPHVETPKNFNKTAYLGDWYEARRLFLHQEIGVKCIKVQCSLTEDGLIEMYNSWTSSIIGSRSHITAYAIAPNPEEPTQLKVKYPLTPMGAEPDYWILGTDYKNYAVIYRCHNLTPATSHQSAWILTREQYPTDEVIKNATIVIERNNLRSSLFLKADQSECEKKFF